MSKAECPFTHIRIRIRISIRMRIKGDIALGYTSFF